MGDMFKTIASKPFIAPYLWMICTRPHLLLDVKDIQLPATEILKITEKLESYMWAWLLSVYQALMTVIFRYSYSALFYRATERIYDHGLESFFYEHDYFEPLTLFVCINSFILTWIIIYYVFSTRIILNMRNYFY